MQLVRENLHVVLAMSPIGDSFRVRCRMFPSLINCCTIDWFNAWPKDALLSVAQRYFADVDFGTQEVKDGICEVCVEMHYSAKLVGADFMASLRRMTYTTPTSYLELLNLYASMLRTLALPLTHTLAQTLPLPLPPLPLPLTLTLTLTRYASMLGEQRGVIAGKIDHYQASSG